MSAETLADIAREMREGVVVGDTEYCREPHLIALADRIEAAAERERAHQEALRINECIVSREEGASEWRKRIGNAAAMRAAFKGLLSALEAVGFRPLVEGDPLAEAVLKARAALSVPPRNCDVGTPSEMQDRFERFCCSHLGCSKCPLPFHNCEFAWAQMPYEAAGKKGGRE